MFVQKSTEPGLIDQNRWANGLTKHAIPELKLTGYQVAD